MDLKNACIVGKNGRHDGTLERTRSGNYVVGFNHTIRRFDPESSSTDILSHKPHLHAAANGGSDQLCVGDKIIRNLLLGGKGIGIDIGEFHTGKSIMPGGTIGNQRVPPLRAPAFGNAVPFKDEMRYAGLAQMLTHSQPRLATTNNNRVYFFN
jgi:hypothetical protein